LLPPDVRFQGQNATHSILAGSAPDPAWGVYRAPSDP